jgi:hypothetical protein
LEDEVNLFLKNLTVGYSLFIHLKSLVFRWINKPCFLTETN